MKPIQINIPDDLKDELERSGVVNEESFIIEAVREHLKEKEGRSPSEDLTDEYKQASKNSDQITGDFDSVDIEGWDEY